MISRLLKAPMPLLRQIVLDRDGKVCPSAQRVVRLVAWAWLTIGVFLFVASWIGMGRPIYGLGYWLVYFSVSALLIALTYPARRDSLRQIRDGLKSKTGGQGLPFGILARTFSLAIALVLGIVRVIDLLLDSFGANCQRHAHQRLRRMRVGGIASIFRMSSWATNTTTRSKMIAGARNETDIHLPVLQSLALDDRGSGDCRSFSRALLGL